MGSKFAVTIVGAGVVGLAIALELQSRGIPCNVAEQAGPGERMPGQASWAAAGMLAAEDPHNPAALRELSRWSAALYDRFLEQIAASGGHPVPFQTRRTRQYLTDGSSRELDERSLDPRQLMTALEAAVKGAGIPVEHGVRVQPEQLLAGAEQVVWAAGAWSQVPGGIKPRRGQMLRVTLPADAEPDLVQRAEDVYVVPRTAGPQAGTALIGATVEDCGFAAGVDETALDDLRRRAARLVPAVADPARARRVEAWVGFRPEAPGGLPVIDRLDATQVVATGHFRNGILLAPATAQAVANLIEGRAADVDLGAFRVPAGQIAHDGR